MKLLNKPVLFLFFNELFLFVTPLLFSICIFEVNEHLGRFQYQQSNAYDIILDNVKIFFVYRFLSFSIIIELLLLMTLKKNKFILHIIYSVLAFHAIIFTPNQVKFSFKVLMDYSDGFILHWLFALAIAYTLSIILRGKVTSPESQ